MSWHPHVSKYRSSCYIETNLYTYTKCSGPKVPLIWGHPANRFKES